MENRIEGMTAQSDAAQNQAPLEPKKIAISKKSLLIAAVIIALSALGALIFYYKSLFIAATVNGSPIYRLSVISELELVSGKKTLESLITKKLIDGEAAAKGIAITPAEVDAEIKKIENQVIAQGGTLEQALAEQGVSLKYLRRQAAVQKELEALLADRIQVSDEEIKKFMADNKITVPAGKEAEYKEQIIGQLKQQKMSASAPALIDSLRTKSRINYFLNY